MEKQKPKRKTISPERRNRFKWSDGDLKFFVNTEELKSHAEEHGEEIIWYGENKPVSRNKPSKIVP